MKGWNRKIICSSGLVRSDSTEEYFCVGIDSDAVSAGFNPNLSFNIYQIEISWLIGR